MRYDDKVANDLGVMCGHWFQVWAVVFRLWCPHGRPKRRTASSFICFMEDIG